MGNFIHDVLHALIAHFVPHEGNDYRPHLLQRTAFVGMMGLVLLSFTMANFQALLWQSSSWLVGAVLPAVVVDLTNAERSELSLSTLTRSPVLDAAAQLKAEDMAKNSYFSHDSPTGVTPWHWFEMANYSYVYAGENLAVYFTDSDAVVDAWMKSPTHRANIVGSQYREIGVGTAKGTYNGYETVFVVQLFGTPALKPVAVTPAPVVPPPVVTQAAVVPPLRAAPVAPLATAPVTVATEPQVAGEATEMPETVVAPAEIAQHSTATEPLFPIPDAESDNPSEVVEPVPAPVVDTLVTDDFVALQSDMAVSKTNLTPAPYVAADTNAGTTAPMLARLATQPHEVLQSVYVVVGFFTLIALFTSIVLEWRKHRPLQTAYGMALIVVMCGLFYLHTLLTGAVLVA